MSVKAVLFDLDDTLTERSLKNPKDLHEAFRQKGIDISVEKIEETCLKLRRELEDILGDHIGRVPHSDLYCIWKSRFLTTLGVKNADGEQLQELNLHWADISETRVFPDVIPILTSLRYRSIKTGIISDAYEEEIRNLLEIADLDENLFDIIVGPDTARKAKPDPEVFMYAVRALEIKPEEAIFVGDDIVRDYKGAERVGMKPFLIVRSKETKESKSLRQIKDLISLMDYLD